MTRLQLAGRQLDLERAAAVHRAGNVHLPELRIVARAVVMLS